MPANIIYIELPEMININSWWPTKPFMTFFSSPQVEKMCDDLLDTLHLCVWDLNIIQNILNTTLNEETFSIIILKVVINRFHTITFSENCFTQFIIDSYLTFHHFIFCVLGFPVQFFYRHFSEQRSTVRMKVSVFWRWKILWCITVI